MKLEVLAARQHVVERWVLEDETDSLADPSRVLDDVDASNLRGAGRGREQCAEDRDGRGLAGPVWPEEAEYLAVTDFEIDAAHGFHLAVSLDQAAGLDYRLRAAVHALT